MRVIYTPKNPADGDRQQWDFDPDDVFADEAELIEEHWGQPWDHFIMHARARSMKAMRLLLWHLMRADHPRRFVNLKDVPRFRTGEVKLQQDSGELRESIQKIRDNPGAFDSSAEQAKALAIGEQELDLAIARETADGVAPVNTPPEQASAEAAVAVPELPPTSEPSVTFGGTTG